MKKITLIIFCLVASVNFLKGQNWSAVGPTSTDTFPERVYAMAVYNSELYAAGYFSSPATVTYVVKWNGSTWTNVGTGMSSSGNLYINALAVYNGELYAGGEFTSAGGNPANNIARWNGTSWSAVSGLNTNDWVYGLGVYNGELYVSGQFTTVAGNPASRIARWNGTTWSAVGAGLGGSAFPCTAYSFCVLNGELYAGGTFTSAGGSPASCIAKWDGANWSALGAGVSGTTYKQIRALTVFNGELYAAGNFIVAGSVSAKNIAKWDGSAWSALGSGLTNPAGNNYATAYSLCVSNSELHVGGAFYSAGGNSTTHLAKWDGLNWTAINGIHCPTGCPDTMLNPPLVNAMALYNSEIYVAGVFDNVGPSLINAYNIAKWDGILTTVVENNNIKNEIHISPNLSSDKFTITTSQKNSCLQIINMLGEKILEQNISSPKTEINLSNHPNGIYFVQLKSSDGIATKKIILSK